MSRPSRSGPAYSDFDYDDRSRYRSRDERYELSDDSDASTYIDSRRRASGARKDQRRGYRDQSSPSRFSSTSDRRSYASEQRSTDPRLRAGRHSSYSTYAPSASGASATPREPRAQSEPRREADNKGKIALAVSLFAVGAFWWLSKDRRERADRQRAIDRRRNFEKEKARRRREEEDRERRQEWEEDRAAEEESTVVSHSRMIDYAPSRSHSRAASKYDGHELTDDREPARLRYEAYNERDEGHERYEGYDQQSEGRSTLRRPEGNRSRSSNNQSIR